MIINYQLTENPFRYDININYQLTENPFRYDLNINYLLTENPSTYELGPIKYWSVKASITNETPPLDPGVWDINLPSLLNWKQ